MIIITVLYCIHNRKCHMYFPRDTCHSLFRPWNQSILARCQAIQRVHRERTTTAIPCSLVWCPFIILSSDRSPGKHVILLPYERVERANAAVAVTASQVKFIIIIFEEIRKPIARYICPANKHVIQSKGESSFSLLSVDRFTAQITISRVKKKNGKNVNRKIRYRFYVFYFCNFLFFIHI